MILVLEVVIGSAVSAPAGPHPSRQRDAGSGALRWRARTSIADASSGPGARTRSMRFAAQEMTTPFMRMGLAKSPHSEFMKQIEG